MNLTMTESQRLYSMACSLMPGGVNSPVRAFKAVGGTPVYIKSGRGAHIFDVDGNKYIDYLGSWGPLILGHANPDVLARVKEAMDRGTSFGAPHEGEIRIASLIRELFPSIELVRLVSSGTEATMSAIRVARGYTGRDRIIKFEGCYHGHADCLLAKAGSGAMTLGIPDSLGVPGGTTTHTITLPYNDIDTFKEVVSSSAPEIAAVIIEPVAGNMGVVPPRKGFLEAVRELTEKHNIVLIFDEVITGFRVAAGGAQELYGIRADMTTLGKILGGGFPIGAYGGKKEIMEKVAPLGGIYQAGTLSGNPVAVAAGIATLEILKSTTNLYRELEEKGSHLIEGIREVLGRKGLKVTINRVGSMFTLFFTGEEIIDYKTAKSADTGAFARFFHAALEEGLYLPPAQFEAAFLSGAHTGGDIEETIKALERIKWTV